MSFADTTTKLFNAVALPTYATYATNRSRGSAQLEPGGVFMTPMVKIERDPAYAMRLRHSLLNLPAEMFAEFFNGRVPTLSEKAMCVEKSVQQMAAVEVWENDVYHVDVNYEPPFAHLAIRRHDGRPCKEWLHFQQIKNEIIGTENEAMELFPAESRLVDSTEQYHLWVHTDPAFRFPMGFKGRHVLTNPADRARLNGGRDIRPQPAMAS